MRLTSAAGSRPGTSLVELTVVIVLLGLMLGGLLSVVDRQQRLYRQGGAAAASRSQVRQAAAILPVELRALAPAAGDIIQPLDSALEIRSTIATGVACERGRDWLTLAPPQPGPAALRGELLPPAEGDVAYLLVADAEDPGRDRWVALTVAQAIDDGDGCRTGPFAAGIRGHGHAALRLRFIPDLPDPVGAGTPVRVTRPVRYSLYRSGDRSWYLGATEWTEGRWSGVQPVSGPYAPYRHGEGGIRFEYLGDAGLPLEAPVDPARISLIRIRVQAPGKSGSGIGVGTRAGSGPRDSAIVSVALRNRPAR